MEEKKSTSLEAPAHAPGTNEPLQRRHRQASSRKKKNLPSQSPPHSPKPNNSGPERIQLAEVLNAPPPPWFTPDELNLLEFLTYTIATWNFRPKEDGDIGLDPAEAAEYAFKALVKNNGKTSKGEPIRDPVGYLTRTIRRRFFDLRRKANKHAAPQAVVVGSDGCESLPASTRADPLSELLHRESLSAIKAKVKSALGKLNGKDRRLLRLRLIHKRKLGEIRKIFKVSKPVLSVRISRAKRKLKKILERDGGLNALFEGCGRGLTQVRRAPTTTRMPICITEKKSLCSFAE